MDTFITKTNSKKPRVAASSYLNSAPLIWSFQHGSHRHAVELVTDTAPARCADLLSRGEVEAALVPIIEYQRIRNIQIVPDVCVGSHSAVRSVVLVSRFDDLTKIRKVALDVSSRTSQALIRIIFREFLGFEPEWKSSSPDVHAMMENNDAALVIGDPGMTIPFDDLRVFDLAGVWHSFTGTGFVFAMWMVADSAARSVGALNFSRVRDEGLENIELIIDQYEKQLCLSRPEISDYLTDNIAFQIDAKLAKGMQLYFELAAKHELIETNKPISFLAS